ncbi:hypothetical protein VPNG_01401 [Cytospora leucostoma]|uniref:Uncharacterized protein n=1 Tax=Cytospora leucostoma TaxID=1230097 RepID=A0A423XM78_9PEZI|nr:hypothetical protein VPNG_01401 [Cytospora leucostoma]
MAQLLHLVTIISYVALRTAAISTSNHPDVDAAQQNAFAIFNSIHSAMRQWGSSVNHNGMSFYLATAPEGSVFYHGNRSPDPPGTFEWLSFEFEHAGSFARSWEPRSFQNALEEPPSGNALAEALLWHRSSHYMAPCVALSEHDSFFDIITAQRPISTSKRDDDDKDLPRRPRFPDKPVRGYLQMYRANRPLNLLYIDGQAAANCELGPIDSQDTVLLDYGSSPPLIYDDYQRAADLCALADEWAFPTGGKLDGFIRMEAGFEIIQCDFSAAGGLDLVSVQASPFRNESRSEEYNAYIHTFEWFRAVTERYHGHPAGRVDIDWSSMVSAYAYPVNLSNPDWSRQDLPRLVNATREGTRGIRERLRQVVSQRGGKHVADDRGVVDWQALADKIVTRFSDRLWYMANGRLTGDALILTIGTVIDPFISYTDHTPMAENLAIGRCTQHYLDPTILHHDVWTPEDHVIAAAIETVSYKICDALFSARNILRSHRTTPLHEVDSSVEQAQTVIRHLVEELRWTTWKECGKCSSPDEVCVIPMFPFGANTDYFSPSCKNITRFRSSMGYWRFGHW